MEDLLLLGVPILQHITVVLTLLDYLSGIMTNQQSRMCAQ